MKIIECPRDAIQGWKSPVSTALKVEYLNALLQVGFDTLDFGSFVSPKAIPQMADTAEVYHQLQLDGISTKLLAIIANIKGAEQAVLFEHITYLGFPFSISETFQQRNTNSSTTQAFETVKVIQELCLKHHKKLVVYFSMGFGNPYGDPYSPDIVGEWAEKMALLGIEIIALSDTVGVAESPLIGQLFSHLIPLYPQIEFGAHLHASPFNWEEKIQAAYHAGCRRFDGALGGFGGCPMANDELVGNINTINLIEKFRDIYPINHQAWQKAVDLSKKIFI
ncbi:hydroxymethylglutaryl-CoA lyase [Flectobacillus sp. DC10W]|jgi:hydroxymethylglutaryl-CoA lyase|uniref:Hydroxymethylglutaryl-CoA lyase n=1 Tax=Flectobacillus longus TaxID=2984207 RepID=A0ABT6YRW2_9BACT|nr:hydroxymethylglutaryl-CoA lyase [Flectobacillus longus]MDI9866184.1 hydroxymethylglutaryl-CoA lyase [Flectobacillus longus]